MKNEAEIERAFGMKHLKVFVFCLASCVIAGAAVAATPEEKAAKEAARAAEKARNEKFNALKKACEELVRKDFKGGFAN